MTKLLSRPVSDSSFALEHIEAGRIDPTFVVTHQLELGQAPEAYETFKHKQDECVKVVLKP